MHCSALFVISKAAFTETSIKPKFNRFSLKILGPAIDPGIGVHWKFFKLSNVGVELSKY